MPKGPRGRAREAFLGNRFSLRRPAYDTDSLRKLPTEFLGHKNIRKFFVTSLKVFSTFAHSLKTFIH